MTVLRNSGEKKGRFSYQHCRAIRAGRFSVIKQKQSHIDLERGNLGDLEMIRVDFDCAN